MWKTRQKVGLLEFESLIFAILSLRSTLDRQAEMSDRQLNWSGELMGKVRTGEFRLGNIGIELGPSERMSVDKGAQDRTHA